MTARIGLIGGRGYTGGELLGLIAGHPQLDLAFASSGSQPGASVSESCPQWPDPETRFSAIDTLQVSEHQADAWVLALPNGKAAAWADAITEAHPSAVILDLSADRRFDEGWAYGLPERNRELIANSRRIANPGCYATGVQIGLLPVRDYLVEPPVVFGVSGYSGAGKTPSDKNDPERLHENLLPYKLTGHVHEQEVSHQLDHTVRFMPHVASFFRGISLTIAARVDHEATPEKLFNHYCNAWKGEPRIRVSADIPEVQAVRETPDVHVGGFAVDAREPSMFTVVVTLDNLSKGAASQAIQNLNLALGFDEHSGLSQGVDTDD